MCSFVQAQKGEMAMTLANMAKAIRQETGMSQKQLAEKIGTNQTEVSFIERGFIPLNPEKQIAIENIFNEVIKENNKK
jgi:transcriptional regulator with XRE-family HTH domain